MPGSQLRCDELPHGNLRSEGLPGSTIRLHGGKFRSGAFDGIHVGAHARSVKPIHHEASKINARSDRIARGSRGVVRNGNRPTSERVEQRALTGVGWSGDHHPRGRDQATEPKVTR